MNEIEPNCGWVLYDGACPLCVGLAERFRRVLERRQFGLAPLQTPWVSARLGLDPEEPLTEMRVLLASGEVFGGADAIVRLARHIVWAWPLCWLARLPGGMRLLRALYAWVAAHRLCSGSVCRRSTPHALRGGVPRAATNPPAFSGRNERAAVRGATHRSATSSTTLNTYRVSATWPRWLPFLAIPLAVWPLQTSLPAWGLMWLLAFALYGGCKWLTFWGALKRGGQLSAARALGYLFLWPGMDAESFLGSKTAVQRPGPAEWAHAAVKVLIGVALIWVVTPLVAVRLDPLLAGWIGMAGLVLLLHFGLFHLLSLAWRSCGVNAERLMRAPFRARSLAEFWGRRWNTAFHQVAEEFLFRPLRPAVGARTALLFVFLVSGWVHELVISLPARGGYSLPTAYFLLQGVGVLAERSRLGRWLRLGAGWRGRLFTLAMTGAPAVALFHPPFVQHVMLPFLKTIGAH